MLSGMASLVGYIIFSQFNGPGPKARLPGQRRWQLVPAILAMIADAMILETFEQAHDYAGLITVSGFFGCLYLSEAR
jgi:ZIP family zinc transporter